MALTTPNMSLKAWDLESDPYDHTDLVNNWIAIDQHDHTPGKGAPLPLSAIPTLPQVALGVCSVSTPQICDGAVTNPKLAQPSVRSTNLYDDSVTQQKLADNSVGTPELRDNAATQSKLAANSVSSDKIQDNAVVNRTIADGSISSGKLGSKAVITSKLDDEAAIEAKIGQSAISTIKVQDKAITQLKIADRAVGMNQFDVLPACYLTLVADKNIPGNDDPNLVVWDTHHYDTDNMWDFQGDRTRIHINHPGIYYLDAGVLWDASSSSVGYRARLRRGGVPVAGVGPTRPESEGVASGTRYRVRQSMSTAIGCQADDWVDLLIQNTTSQTQQISSDGVTTHLSVMWMGPLP